VKPNPLQSNQLAAFEGLVREKGTRLGLIASKDLPRIRERHIDDSLRAVPHIAPTDLRAYDLGSGAGFPGLVLAIAVPTCRFVLVESRSRRAGFLELALERLGLGNAEVFHGRAEDLASPADLVTARAFATIGRTWRIAYPLLRAGGRLIYFAGAGTGLSIPPSPEPPEAVEVDRRLAKEGPLVIMTRG
jgi:16S rRNA (guanine527-N7)-methyltransferase